MSSDSPALLCVATTAGIPSTIHGTDFPADGTCPVASMDGGPAGNAVTLGTVIPYSVGQEKRTIQ